MDIFYTVAGGAATIFFSGVVFVVFAIAFDLVTGKVPSLPLTKLTPALAGVSFIGFALLDMWSRWQWFSDIGWVSVVVTAISLLLRWLTVRRARRAAAPGQPEGEPLD